MGEILEGMMTYGWAVLCALLVVGFMTYFYFSNQITPIPTKSNLTRNERVDNFCKMAGYNSSIYRTTQLYCENESYAYPILNIDDYNFKILTYPI